ncbi:MAG: hypothetical protein K9J13_12670, partial [Saprospiraceae bacterium]|nr:hypothetical protein [Saprospiraceae bacterium]
MKNLRFILLFVFLFSFGALFSQYQLFFDPTTTDNFITTGIITNTGCDSRQVPDEIWDMDVMVWDVSGSDGKFAWNCTNSNGDFALDGGSDVEDPDVVLGPNGSSVSALVVYEISGDIYYEIWDFDKNANTWSVNTPSTDITSGYGGCDNPNVDVDQDGNVVIVWEENGDIMAVAGSITGGLNSPETVYSTNTNSVPDVCIYTNDNGTNVGFTYIKDDGSDYHLAQQDEDYSDVTAGSMNQNPVFLKKADQSANESFGRPRIAAPGDGGSPQLGDYEIVFRFLWYDMSTPYYEIYGYNKYQGTTNWDTINSQANPGAGNLTAEYNFEPVVTYSNLRQMIIVSWQYFNSASKYGSLSTYDVLVRELSLDGNLINYPGNDPWYSILNYTELGMQAKPSVAQRFSYGNDVFFAYFDLISSPYTSRLAYNNCDPVNYQLRKQNPELINIDDD